MSKHEDSNPIEFIGRIPRRISDQRVTICDREKGFISGQIQRGPRIGIKKCSARLKFETAINNLQKGNLSDPIRNLNSNTPIVNQLERIDSDEILEIIINTIRIKIGYQRNIQI